MDVTEFVQQQVKDGAYLKLSVEDAVRSAPENPAFIKDGKVLPGMQLIVTYKQGDGSNQIVSEYFDRAALVASVKDASGLDYADGAMGSVDVAAAQKDFEKSMKAEQAEKVEEAAIENLSDKIRMKMVQGSWKDEEQEKTVVKDLQRLESNGDRAIVMPAFEMARDARAWYVKVWDALFTPESEMVKDEALLKPLEVSRAEVGMKPAPLTGWLVTAFFVVFIAFYAAGPGVCVWLALSELMPTRIRANGMAIALLINQTVSTTIAGTFLPWVGAYGYSSVFFTLAGFTVIYFITAAFFMPETKGRTLEEIEKYFTTGKMPE